MDYYAEMFSGVLFNLTTPVVDEVHIKDIAHHLAKICRFNGGTSEYYSVAEHSLQVKLMLEYDKQPTAMLLHGLLHDAHEAYVGDLTTPVKRLLGFRYDQMLQPIDAAISKRFGVPVVCEPGDAVEAADLKMLAIEAWYMMPSGGEGKHWKRLPLVTDFEKRLFKPHRWSSEDAEREFLGAYNELVTRLRKERGGTVASYAV